MTTRERIGTAQHSDDLGEVQLDEIGDVDIIRACGMSGQSNPLGLMLWRWRVGGDRRELPKIAQALIDLGHSETIVLRVLTHMMDDICKPCSGRGYEVIPDTPVLSDNLCTHCRGSGRKTLEDNESLKLVEYIASLERSIAGDVMSRLNRDMNF